MRPLVSVLICSYNAEKFIKETIQSVLSQTYPELELLILDNASKDKTAEIVRQIASKDRRVKLFANETNLGSYPGLNYLLERAKGIYIAINDHDDIWHPEKLARQVDFLENHKEYAGCGTAIINWYEKYRKTIYRTQPEKADVSWHTTLVFRNGGFRYDTSVKLGTDFYFMKNILSKDKKKIYNFPEPMVYRRIFAGSQNLSGQWMKKTSFRDIAGLKVGLLDKLALFNRRILPQEYVERALVNLMGNNTPSRYNVYASSFLNSVSKRS